MSLFWRFFRCQVCSFFSLFKSSSFGCVLHFTKCVWFGLPCEFFELRAICIENFFRIITFFYDLFRLWVCVWTEYWAKKIKTQHKSTKFSLRRRPFICRHAVFEWTAVNNKKMSHCMTQNRSLIAFSLSSIAKISKSNVAEGVRNMYSS